VLFVGFAARPVPAPTPPTPSPETGPKRERGSLIPALPFALRCNLRSRPAARGRSASRQSDWESQRTRVRPIIMRKRKSVGLVGEAAMLCSKAFPSPARP